MSTKATEEALSGLHGAMATAMAKKLESGEYTASDLNVIRQFLKDNGIQADGEKNPELRKLSDDLPDLPDDTNITPFPSYGG